MFKFVISARNDYYRNESDYYDEWLLNPNWTVHPSTGFIDGNCPTILICYDHNYGTTKYIIHICRSPDNVLPQPFSDQLCNTVIQNRTVRPVQAKIIPHHFKCTSNVEHSTVLIPAVLLILDGLT